MFQVLVLVALGSSALLQSTQPSLPATQPSMLDQDVEEVSFNHMKLKDVLDSLRSRNRVNIMANFSALGKVGVGPDTPVTLELQASPLRTVLQFILESAGGADKKLGYTEEYAMIIVSTEADIADRANHPSHGLLAPLAVRGDETDVANTKDALARTLPEINFSGVPASDAVQILTEMTRLSIDVDWDALEKAGIPRDSPVVVRVNDLTLERVIQVFNAQMSNDQTTVRYIIDGDHVKVSTEAELSKK